MAVAAPLVSRLCGFLCGFLCARTTIGVITLVNSASLSQIAHLRTPVEPMDMLSALSNQRLCTACAVLYDLTVAVKGGLLSLSLAVWPPLPDNAVARWAGTVWL